MGHPDPDLLTLLARELADESDTQGVLTRVVHASVAQIDGAEHAGITSISNNAVSTPVATDEVVRLIDELQYAAGQGPCLTAATEREPVVIVHDLRSEHRWPRFSSTAAAQGIRSMLSFQLYTGQGNRTDTIGALNVYAAKADAFDDDSIHTGTLLAAHAAVAAATAARTANLRVALESRDVIGQAKGILMERYKLTPDEAFDLLIAASQHTHLKLRDVADRLSATGELAVD